jgi:hypothetical protein
MHTHCVGAWKHGDGRPNVVTAFVKTDLLLVITSYLLVGQNAFKPPPPAKVDSSTGAIVAGVGQVHVGARA